MYSKYNLYLYTFFYIESGASGIKDNYCHQCKSQLYDKISINFQEQIDFKLQPSPQYSTFKLKLCLISSQEHFYPFHRHR